ncbi:Fucose permease [Mucilaginibacter lappiensis]|uniref:Fucose permease n=1 Tax=Mucilaginibacter lappiensis TaxID=354630 RepID=A0ABR6PTF2_9SPHI|nr:MFS transporter [Mucilaginibacter lappiensis]MBB6113063.1 fucose permease [Mucilaginibacter lappiensis]SIS10840.1 Fucose permease [Mucilaginibacter lappiensis]
MNLIDNTFDLKLVSRAKLATQAIFLVCGFGVSSWAVMVPFAKSRLHLNDAELGGLLLLLGAGSVTMMPLTGILMGRIGSRRLIFIAALLIALCLPLLLILNTPLTLGIALFFFGAGIGTIDVAMNAHGVQVQNLYGKPIMSSLHGLFSVGGLLGSLGLGFLIRLGAQPFYAAVIIALSLLLIAIIGYRSLLSLDIESAAIKRFSLVVHGISGRMTNAWFSPVAIFLGVLCFAVFLAEGAMLDWSALFLKEYRGIDPSLAGAGYAAFSVAMATTRLFGDRLVARLKSDRTVIFGSLVAGTGTFIAIILPWLAGTLFGFFLIGLGAANVVPVFFSEAGRLKGVSTAMAVSVIATLGYGGQLAGPAFLGFIAQHFTLPVALGVVGILLFFVTIAYGIRRMKMGSNN